jgi:putative ABC transport system substrate-binding protein
MKRRHLVAGALAAPWFAVPFARAQNAPPRIAYLSGRSEATDAHLLEAFREGLKTLGYVEGHNVTFDVRWADGRYQDVPAMAQSVAATKPDLFVAVGGNPVGLAAKAATSTIPVLFAAGADPVTIGLVGNLNRPEANLTGITLLANELDAKRLDLLHDLLPATRRVALMLNPENPGYGEQRPRAQEAAKALGLELQLLDASSSAQIRSGFAALAAGTDAFSVGADAFLINRRDLILQLAAERRLPGIYPAREFAVDGGLLSYGTRWADMYRILGSYGGRILKGARPIELPVQRPATYELVINMQTARALGVQIPPLILTRADELIE